MRNRLVVFAALLLLVATLGMASAQGGPGGGRGFGGRGGGGLGLLRMETVQKELKMTQPQIDKLDAKNQEIRSQMQELFQSAGNPQDMTPEDRQKMMDKMNTIQNKAVEDILDTTQLKRFHQLELQRMGYSALARKDIADKLSLTDDQKKSIADIQKKAQEDMQAAMQGKDFRNMSDEDRKAMQTTMAANRKATDAALKAVLTEDQAKAFKAMQGDPFDFGPMPGRGQRPAGA